MCAAPATEQVQRLPRKVPRRHGRLTAPKCATMEPAQCCKCHACHAKRRWMCAGATTATQNESGCRQAPRLPRKVPAAPRATNGAQARHQSQPSVMIACKTKEIATQNEGGCRQVLRLPRKTKVDVSKCHACHAKCRAATGD